MKTLGFKISKKLSDLGLLDNIETEYYLDGNNGSIIKPDEKYYNNDIKTLTLEEVIEFLGDKYFIQISGGGFNKNNYNICIIIKNINYQGEGETLLDAIEKIIEFLLDNNLLRKNKIGYTLQ